MFVGAPFGIASGSPIRAAKVLPLLADMVRSRTCCEVLLHIPASSIRYVVATLAVSDGPVAAAELPFPERLLRVPEQSSQGNEVLREPEGPRILGRGRYAE
jgi:hypothetical protein